jgi:RNA polymerase sigma-70 factor (ECF subfamily)
LCHGKYGRDPLNEQPKPGSGAEQPAPENLEPYRQRLVQYVASQMDARLRPRLDPSDVVQEAFAEVLRRGQSQMPSLSQRYPWLCGIALDKLKDQHRRHILAQRRAVDREHGAAAEQPHGSSSPSKNLRQAEERRRLQAALLLLTPLDQTLLDMRYQRQMKLKQIADELKISETAAKTRHFRALRKLGRLLGERPDDQG